MCGSPLRRGVEEFGCGQCNPCLFNRRRMWTIRLMLESCQHEASLFVTLTYAPEFLPEGGNLVPEDLQRYLKRLRRRIEPVRVRFYGVGEYGDVGGRPHYHLALFGVGALHAASVRAAWAFGGVHVGELTLESAGYIVGYITKRWTRVGASGLDGRHPEFARMSLRPYGIGGGAADVIAREVIDAETGEVRAVDANGDVPGVVRSGRKVWSVGRYLRGRIRERCGMGTAEPEAVRARRLRDLQAALLVPGAWALREGKRASGVDRARVRKQIKNSRRRF